MHLFTDDEKILSKLTEKGNPLERLDAVMDGNSFSPCYQNCFLARIKLLVVEVVLTLITS